MALRYTLTFINIPKNQEENPIFDSLSTYIDSIASASKLIVNDASPFDLTLSTSCRIQLTDNTSFLNKQLVYNYCKVTKYSTGASNTYYFWVKRNTRLSNNVIQFDMEMDTLNTFKGGIESSCQTKKNYIERCHVDRYVKESATSHHAIVDDISEGFGLVQYESSRLKIEYSYNSTQPFENRELYLLLKSEQLSYKSNVQAARTITYTALDGTTKTLELPLQDVSIEGVRASVGLVTDFPAIVKDSNNNYLDWDILEYTRKIQGIDENKFAEYVAQNGYINHRIDAWKDIDKSTSTTIKVKNIPYPPIPMHLSTEGFETVINIDDTSSLSADYGIGLIYLPNPANGVIMREGGYAAWGRYLALRRTDNLVPFPKYRLRTHIINFSLPSPNSASINDDWQYNDPKIYHSDFYTAKYFYYDSVYILKPENINFSGNNIVNDVNYQVTTELSLDFLFQISPRDGFKHKESDFEGNIIVSTAPEQTLFSSEYINYMRNGYGYDQYNHTWKLANSIFSLASSSIRQAGNFVESVMGEDYAGAAASAIDFFGGFVKFASSEVLWGNKINRQRQTLNQQSPQISDTKNGQLIKEITGNRLYFSEYKPKQSEIDKLNKLFHYYGYARGLYGEMPYNTRSWFNFIQGDIHLERRVPEYAIPDVKARFKAGVTFYHYHNNTYDFEQEKENWEVSLL